MDIDIANHDGIQIIKLTGKLDALTGPDCEQRLNRLIADGARHLVLDLSALLYVSSAGLRVFLNTAKQIQALGGRLAYASLQDSVREVFEMTGLLNLFTVRDSLAEALESVQSA